MRFCNPSKAYGIKGTVRLCVCFFFFFFFGGGTLYFGQHFVLIPRTRQAWKTRPAREGGGGGGGGFLPEIFRGWRLSNLVYIFSYKEVG